METTEKRRALWAEEHIDQKELFQTLSYFESTWFEASRNALIRVLLNEQGMVNIESVGANLSKLKYLEERVTQFKIEYNIAYLVFCSVMTDLANFLEKQGVYTKEDVQEITDQYTLE